MDPQIIPEVLTLLTPEQSAANKDLVLNFLLATTALAGTVISAYFIKRAGISLNSFNYIRRKVFRDQNRLGTQLHKNRDKVELIKAKIAVIEELKDENKDFFNEIFVKKHFDSYLHVWRVKIQHICGDEKPGVGKKVGKIMTSINTKKGEAAEELKNDVVEKLEALEDEFTKSDIFIFSETFLKRREIEKNKKEILKLEERSSQLKKYYFLQNIRTTGTDPFSEIQKLAKDLKKSVVDEIEKIEKSEEIAQNSVLLDLLIGLKKAKTKKIHVVLDDLEKIKEEYWKLSDLSELVKLKKKIEEDWKFSEPWTESTFKKLEETLKEFGTDEKSIKKKIKALEKKNVKPVKDSKPIDENKYGEFNKKFEEGKDKLVKNCLFSLDLFDKTFDNTGNAKTNFNENYKSHFYSDIKDAIIGNNKDQDHSGTVSRDIKRYDFEDILNRDNMSFDDSIKKLNKKNNEFDFYDLQISDQIQVSRMYKEIMLQKDSIKEDK
jgi:hypothetical protein